MYLGLDTGKRIPCVIFEESRFVFNYFCRSKLNYPKVL